MTKSAPPFAPPTPFLRTGWTCAALVLLTLIAYGPALGGDFIWDDAGHVTRLDLQSISGLGRIWFEVGATQQYYPLLHSAFWIEHLLWGDATLGYHVLNVILHAAAACLLGKVLTRLAIPGAWLAAFVFALHPVCVESVAWITEQKNTLSAVFYLSAALVYLHFDTERRPSTYFAATLLFVCALLSKTVTATLPAALLVVLWWKRGKLEMRRDVLPVLPWFAFSIAAGLVTAWVEHRFIGAKGEAFDLSLLQRCLLAGRVAWFYAAKVLWPLNLSFNYPHWTIDASSLLQWLWPLLAVAAIALLFWRRQRGLLAGVLFFGGTLFPALGFVNVYPFLFSYVADHFQYLACIGLIVPAAAGITRAAEAFSRSVSYSAAALWVALLGLLTFQHSATYRDVTTLYETTLRQNPDSWLSHNNLAEALGNAGQIDEAIPHLQEALRLRPNFPEAENNLGHDLTLLGRVGEGISHLQRAIELAPTSAEAHNNLGVAFMALNRTAEGTTEFERALALQPRYPGAHVNLGLALARAGRTEDAIRHFEEAARLQPNYAAAELNWAIGLMLTHRFDQAIPHFERAVKLEPDSIDNQLTYGRALANEKRFDDAVTHFREVLRMDPENADAHANLALALHALGRNAEADHHRIEAERLRKRSAP